MFFAAALPGVSRARPAWRRRRARFAIRAAAFAFFVNVGREIAGLAQLADRFVRRIGFDQARWIPDRGNRELRK